MQNIIYYLENCKFEECKEVCKKYSIIDFNEEIEMKEVENEVYIKRDIII